MKNEKRILKIAALMVAGLLVVGAAKSFARGPFGGPWEGDRTDRLTRQLDLTDDQETKVRKIVRDAEKKQEELSDKYRDSRKAESTEMEKLRTETETSVNALLTDAQKAKFKELTDRRETRGGTINSFGRGGCNGPGDCGQAKGGGFNCGEGRGRGNCDGNGPGR